MSTSYLWVKALHLVFVSSWFAGLFYLPRLFVNLASVPADSHAERERLLMMARRLYRFSSLLMIPALALGLALWWFYGVGREPGAYWLHAKWLLSQYGTIPLKFLSLYLAETAWRYNRRRVHDVELEQRMRKTTPADVENWAKVR